MATQSKAAPLNEAAVIRNLSLVSVLGNAVLSGFKLFAGITGHSSAMISDAVHSFSDVLTTLIGIAGAMLGFPVLDSVASVVICLFILKVSYDIIKDAVTKLLETSCGTEYEEKLRRFIAGQNGVEGVDLLHTRMFGNKVYIDLEFEVDGDKTLREAHAVAEQVHTDVEGAFPEVKHVMIHVNPAKA